MAAFSENFYAEIHVFVQKVKHIRLYLVIERTYSSFGK